MKPTGGVPTTAGLAVPRSLPLPSLLHLVRPATPVLSPLHGSSQLQAVGQLLVSRHQSQAELERAGRLLGFSERQEGLTSPEPRPEVLRRPSRGRGGVRQRALPVLPAGPSPPPAPPRTPAPPPRSPPPGT